MLQSKFDFAQIIPRGLIVSCQAYAGEPLFGANIMAAYARAAEVGGAVAVHAGLMDDLAAIRQRAPLPLIGMHKGAYSRSGPYITTMFEQARAVAEAGADVVEIDGTLRPREVSLEALINFIHAELKKPVLAGVSCLEDAAYAQALGADALSTFLAGYTTHGRLMTDGPDIEFVAQVAGRTALPVVSEGRFKTPAELALAMGAGAHAVLVAAAIARPQDITRRFVAAMNLPAPTP